MCFAEASVETPDVLISPKSLLRVFLCQDNKLERTVGIWKVLEL